MNVQTQLPFEDLSPWYFAVRWARLTLQQKVHDYKTQGFTFNVDYDFQVLERLESLEEFLQYAWDETLGNAVQTPVETVSND